MVAEHRRYRAACHPRTHDNAVESVLFLVTRVAAMQYAHGERTVAALLDAGNLRVVMKAHAAALAGLGETARELVDVTG